MKKFLRGMLCVGVVSLACMAGKAYAGEKANVVVSDSAGKELVVKSVTLVSGSSTVASGLGTATNAVFSANYTSAGTITARFACTASGANVLVYAYDLMGATSTSGYTGSLFIWGTP